MALRITEIVSFTKNEGDKGSLPERLGFEPEPQKRTWVSSGDSRMETLPAKCLPGRLPPESERSPQP